MGYYNDLSLGETRTTDDDWYDRADYGRVIAPVAPRTPAPSPEPRAPTSDLPIPPLARIRDRAMECRASAVRLSDEPTVRQLTRLLDSLNDADYYWMLGTLIVCSPSGNRYGVTRAGCNCPNGTKSGARACWHVALFELLLDLFATDCDSADMACDPPSEPCPLGGDEGDTLPSARAFGARLATARSCYSYV